MKNAFTNRSEEEKLAEVLATTHTERFFKLMKLIKIDRMLKNAKITHVKAGN
jgi:hypothetical protein